MKSSIAVLAGVIILAILMLFIALRSPLLRSLVGWFRDAGTFSVPAQVEQKETPRF